MAVTNLHYKLVADFTPLEKAFKYVYDNSMTPEKALRSLETGHELNRILSISQQDRDAFEQILKNLKDTQALYDDAFFTAIDDLFINIHSRYMPELLHKHQFFELQYVIEGTLNQVVAGHELSLHAGDICFIAPETMHAVSIFDDETILVNVLIKVDTFRSVFINLLNKEDVISDFFSRVLFCNSFYPYIYCRTRIAQKLTPVVMDMIETDNSSMPYKSRLMVTKLEEIFILLLNHHEFDFVTGSTLGDTDKKVLPMLRYIQDNFKTVTLTDMASYFNYSESYLSRIITTYSGSSFSEVVKSAKLRNAARLLESSDMPIGDISMESGYEDRTYFHKAFKKQYGMTPAEYRKSRNKNS